MSGLQIILCFSMSLVWANGTSLEEFTEGNNLFTSALYKELAKTNQGNILVSPFSVETILALTQSGAKGETAAEIRNVLNLPDTDDEIRAIFKNVLPTLKSVSNVTLNTANKIYVKDSYTLRDNFKKIANEIYQGDVENIDFSKKIGAADAMNQWVEQQTESKIKNLIAPDGVDDSTVALLINALHFKGTWVNGFGKNSTKKRNFYKTTGNVIQVDTMYSSTLLRKYFIDKELNAKFLEMPFLGDDFSMILVLPDGRDGIFSLETSLEKVFVKRDFQMQYIEVALPKFRIETAIDLKNILLNIGLKNAFSVNKADFSGIVNGQNLYISEIFQKVFIDVDENGVEGAAASFDDLRVLSSFTPFYADHPFLFYIKFKDLILFAGRVSDPGI